MYEIVREPERYPITVVKHDHKDLFTSLYGLSCLLADPLRTSVLPYPRRINDVRHDAIRGLYNYTMTMDQTISTPTYQQYSAPVPGNSSTLPIREKWTTTTMLEYLTTQTDIILRPRSLDFRRVLVVARTSDATAECHTRLARVTTQFPLLV